jgi:RimJ/RimL family protein N-acetyltransferase
MKILETDRLTLRHLTTDDAPFILELLNDPDFLRFIGDKGVRTLGDARQYIIDGPMASYARLSFGLFLVELKDERLPIGICGLIKRDALVDVDIGFAFLPAYRLGGYGFESALAVRDYAFNVIGLKRIAAITNPDNTGSMKLLEKIGLRFERMIVLTPESTEIRLYLIEQ